MQQIRNAGVVNRDAAMKNAAVPVHRTIASKCALHIGDLDMAWDEDRLGVKNGD